MERFDFDTVIDRKNTTCLKYDFAGEYGVPEDTLPFWIADMDFKVADCITDALRDRVEHGIYGYSDTGVSYFRALAGRKNISTGISARNGSSKLPASFPPSTSP